MFNDGDFHHYIIHKYHAYFAALFSNVNIDRNLTDGELSARFKVPLHFAKMEHALERVEEDPTINRPDAIVLPALSWDFLGMSYAGNRKIPTRNRFSVASSDPSKLAVMHAPVPYDFKYQLSALVKNYNDALKIIEQIAPYFAPDFTTRLELIPDMGLIQEIPVVLDQVDLDFEFPEAYKERVTQIVNFDFTLQGYLYGPQKNWPIVKFSTIDIGAFPSTNSQFVIVTSTPGLTANGQPTESANQSINALSISISSDYGYIDTSNTALGNRT